MAELIGIEAPVAAPCITLAVAMLAVTFARLEAWLGFGPGFGPLGLFLGLKKKNLQKT